MILVKMAALVLSLGVDTLAVSASVGPAESRGRLRLALFMAAFEAGMPLIGVLLGREATRLVGPVTGLLGALLLLAVGIYLSFSDRDDAIATLPRRGWLLVLAGLSVSLDELAIGFSLALVGVPVVPTVLLILVQAFTLSLVGSALGTRLRAFLGVWANKVAGSVLILLGILVGSRLLA